MPKLKGYHRPPTIDQALQLLSRPGINTTVLGGGSYLTAHVPETVDEIVDLQAVAGLDQVNYNGQRLTLGAMVRLQTIVDDRQAPLLLRETAKLEGPNTYRNTATVGGSLIIPNRESQLVAAFLVFEAEVHIHSTNGEKTVSLTQFLQDIPSALGGGLVTAVSLVTGGKTARAQVARTPTDKPIVAVLARQADNDQIRLALCGVANTPVLVEPDNVKAAVNPPNDFRGSREYRRQMAATLSKRVLDELSEDRQ